MITYAAANALLARGQEAINPRAFPESVQYNAQQYILE